MMTDWVVLRPWEGAESAATPAAGGAAVAGPELRKLCKVQHLLFTEINFSLFFVF